MAFSSSRDCFYSPADDVKRLQINTSDALQQHNTHELLHPITLEDEQELLAAIRHNIETNNSAGTCCVCGIAVSTTKNIRIKLTAEHKGHEVFRAIFHQHCMPLLWQTLLTQTTNKQKFALCHGTEADDDVHTKVADVHY